MVKAEEEKDNHLELNIFETVIRIYDKMHEFRALVNSDSLAQLILLSSKRAARKSIGDR